ncbi:hypothetical protein RUM43_002604, partial [Polyplax serrata]
ELEMRETRQKSAKSSTRNILSLLYNTTTTVQKLFRRNVKVPTVYGQLKEGDMGHHQVEP